MKHDNDNRRQAPGGASRDAELPRDVVKRLEDLCRQHIASVEKARVDAVALVNARCVTLRGSVDGDFREAVAVLRLLSRQQAHRLDEIQRRILGLLEKTRTDMVASVNQHHGALAEHMTADFQDVVSALQSLPSAAAGRLDLLRRKAADRLTKMAGDLPDALQASYAALIARIKSVFQEAGRFFGPPSHSAKWSVDDLHRKTIAGIGAARDETLKLVRARHKLLSRQIDSSFQAAVLALDTPRQAVRTATAIAADRVDPIPDRLDLHGFQADEALITLELFLQHAQSAGAVRVSIIHGKGSGILRSAVRDFLPHHPLVESVEFGAHLPGDDGVTDAILRRGPVPPREPAPPHLRHSAYSPGRSGRRGAR